MRQPLGLIHVLGRQQDRRAGVDQFLDEAPDVVACTRIKPRRRLVEEQHGRTGDQARTDVKAPPHPAGVRPDQPVGGLGQGKALEHVLGAAAVLALLEVVPEPDELEILAAGEQLIDRGVLAGEPDHRAQRSGVGDDVVAGDARAAAVGPQQGRQDPHQGRLAGPVGAQQGEHPALLGCKVDAGQRCRRSEAFRDGLHLDHRSGHLKPRNV